MHYVLPLHNGVIVWMCDSASYFSTNYILFSEVALEARLHVVKMSQKMSQRNPHLMVHLRMFDPFDCHVFPGPTRNKRRTKRPLHVKRAPKSLRNPRLRL